MKQMTDMATRTKYVKKGKWRTLEWFVNATGTGYFVSPSGARIKVRYGVGVLGYDRQKQILNVRDRKTLSVEAASIAYARMRMRVQESMEVTYEIIP